ncbi:MAG TPA: calcium-binding protein, partial [Actinomycetota bacterium]
MRSGIMAPTMPASRVQIMLQVQLYPPSHFWTNDGSRIGHSALDQGRRPLHRWAMRRGAILLAIGALLVSGMQYARAGALTSCSFDEPGATVQVQFADDEAATLSRSGEAIALDGSPCQTATVSNTDTIDVFGALGAESLTIDLGGGPLAPGVTDEGDGSSEIEIVTGHLATFPETLTIQGGPSNDVFVFEREPQPSDAAVNLNGDETDPDSDIVFSSVSVDVILRGGAGDDELSNADVPALELQGEDGNDTIKSLGLIDNLVAGGPGSDTLDLSAVPELEIFADMSWPLLIVDGDHMISMTAIEHLIGGPGPDTLIGSEGDDILEGGEGGDVITGLGGNDVLDGGGQFGDGGYDEVHFDDAPGPVTIDVGAGTAIGDGSDAISGFEVVQGSGFDDRFIGAPGLDGFYGLDGADTIDYRTSSKGVKADLSVGVEGTEHGDFFDSVERAIGTHF